MSISNVLSLVVTTPSSTVSPTPMACLKVVKEIGKELVIELPWGEQVSIGTERVNKLFGFASRSGGRVRCMKSTEDLTSLHLAICKAISQGSSALVQVSKTTTGKTDRSRKVRVDGVMHRPHDPCDHPPIKSHTVTVPAMHVHTHDDKCYVPRWVLMRAIHQNVLEGKGVLGSGLRGCGRSCLCQWSKSLHISLMSKPGGRPSGPLRARSALLRKGSAQ